MEHASTLRTGVGRSMRRFRNPIHLRQHSLVVLHQWADTTDRRGHTVKILRTGWGGFKRKRV